jgi:activator of HSP90 ATPase
MKVKEAMKPIEV